MAGLSTWYAGAKQPLQEAAAFPQPQQIFTSLDRDDYGGYDYSDSSYSMAKLDVYSWLAVTSFLCVLTFLIWRCLYDPTKCTMRRRRRSSAKDPLLEATAAVLGVLEKGRLLWEG